MADDKTFTQADLDAAVAKATGDVDGLKSKIDELIGDNKKLKADLRKTQDIKPEDVAALEHQVDELKGKLTTAEKAAKEATTAAEKATKALETEQGFTQRLLIQDGLKSELIKAGVKDEDYLDMAVAKFAPGASIKVDGEERKAMYGDKALGDFIKEWAATDAGKKVIAAPVNGGGGAGGGGSGGGSGKTAKQSEINAMRPKERAAFFAQGGTAIDDA